MNKFLKIALRAMLTIAVLFGAQYLIPYYFLVPVALVAGVFMLKTGDDREVALGVLAGAVVFGVFAWKMAQLYPMK